MELIESLTGQNNLTASTLRSLERNKLICLIELLLEVLDQSASLIFAWRLVGTLSVAKQAQGAIGLFYISSARLLA